MAYDYSKLNGRIIEVCGTRKAFAEMIGISEPLLSLKLSGKSPFKQKEIYNSMRILNIQPENIGAYFFKIKVKNS